MCVPLPRSIDWKQNVSIKYLYFDYIFDLCCVSFWRVFRIVEEGLHFFYHSYHCVELLSMFSRAAVWPGWGHASENPKLPTMLKERGIQVKPCSHELGVWSALPYRNRLIMLLLVSYASCNISVALLCRTRRWKTNLLFPQLSLILFLARIAPRYFSMPCLIQNY